MDTVKLHRYAKVGCFTSGFFPYKKLLPICSGVVNLWISIFPMNTGCYKNRHLTAYMYENNYM